MLARQPSAYVFRPLFEVGNLFKKLTWVPESVLESKESQHVILVYHLQGGNWSIKLGLVPVAKQEWRLVCKSGASTRYPTGVVIGQ